MEVMFAPKPPTRPGRYWVKAPGGEVYSRCFFRNDFPLAQGAWDGYLFALEGILKDEEGVTTSNEVRLFEALRDAHPLVLRHDWRRAEEIAALLREVATGAELRWKDIDYRRAKDLLVEATSRYFLGEMGREELALAEKTYSWARTRLVNVVFGELPEVLCPRCDGRGWVYWHTLKEDES
jgi:hypothetical protein